MIALRSLTAVAACLALAACVNVKQNPAMGNANVNVDPGQLVDAPAGAARGTTDGGVGTLPPKKFWKVLTVMPPG